MVGVKNGGHKKASAYRDCCSPASVDSSLKAAVSNLSLIHI